MSTNAQTVQVTLALPKDIYERAAELAKSEEQPIGDFLSSLVAEGLEARGTVRETLERVGLFGTELQRVRDGIGSMEDHEWQMRLWAAGCQAMYVPEIRCNDDEMKVRVTERK